MFVMDSLYICKYMHIYFQRILFEQTDSILSLNKPLGNNCKIKIYISEIGSSYVFFSFGDITPKQIKIYQKNELYLQDNCKKLKEPLCKSSKGCHVSFCTSICNECCTQTNIPVACNSDCYIVCNSYVLWCTLTFFFDI